MAIDTEALLLTAVGVGIIITGVVLIMTLRSQPAVQKTVDVVPEPVGWGWGWGRGWGGPPYYSYLPVRPMIY